MKEFKRELKDNYISYLKIRKILVDLEKYKPFMPFIGILPTNNDEALLTKLGEFHIHHRHDYLYTRLTGIIFTDQNFLNKHKNVIEKLFYVEDIYYYFMNLGYYKPVQLGKVICEPELDFNYREYLNNSVIREYFATKLHIKLNIITYHHKINVNNHIIRGIDYETRIN
jgi:hypothetical protein